MTFIRDVEVHKLSALSFIAQIRQYRDIAQDVQARYGQSQEQIVGDQPTEDTANTSTSVPKDEEATIESEKEKSPTRSIASEGKQDTNQTSQEPQTITWEAENTLNPHNFSYGMKWTYILIIGTTNFLTSGAAAFDAEVVPQAMATYNLHGTSGEQVALLATTLYMVAFGLGTPIAAPFSETFGRNVVYIASLISFGAFALGSAAAPNVQTWIICRTLMGFFGSPPAVTFGGSMADMWGYNERTYVFPVLSSAVFVGPFLAPMVADFIATSPVVNWHWTSWTCAIFAGALAVVIAVVVPETRAPVLLAYKAKCMRRTMQSENYVGAKGRQIPLPIRLKACLLVPWTLLSTEPILLLFTLYLVVIYAVLFAFLPAFSYIFGQQGYYNFPQTGVGLCYLSMDVGFIVPLVLLFWIYPRYLRKTKEAQAEGRKGAWPEERLWFSMIGAPFLPVSIYWLAWTPPTGVSFWCPLVAAGLFGFAALVIFISIYQYVIDAYEVHCASALVGMTITRYIVGGMMIHAAIPMIDNMGLPKALTVWASFAAAMAPVPYLFYWKGHVIRGMSKRASQFGV